MGMVKMKIEQKIVAAYSVIGLACGLISDYFTPANLTFALLVPAAIYFATMLPLVKLVKEQKMRMLVSNSLITFFLVWIMVWVFLYNI